MLTAPNPHYSSYIKYIKVVKRQLEEAKFQVERIPELERVSKMEFNEWLGFQKYCGDVIYSPPLEKKDGD